MTNQEFGIIGNGIHSKRIQNILNTLNKKYFIFTSKHKENIKLLEKLKKCKIVFIVSPNKTHFHYIKMLHKNSYIFCEKPPVSERRDLIKTSKLFHKKI